MSSQNQGNAPSRRPALIVVAGGVASGKSTVARALAERLGASLLEADRIRGTLLQAAVHEEVGVEARWRRDLSPQFEHEIYDDLLRRAGDELEAGRSLVLDACFPRRTQRGVARALAARHGVDFLSVHCSVPETTLRERLAARDRAAGRPVWQAIHDHLAAHVEPRQEPAEGRWIEIRSDDTVGPLVDSIVAALDARVSAARARPSDETGLRPRAVSFDCWNTLLVEEDWPWAHSLRVMALQGAARDAGLTVERAAAARAFDAAWAQHMEGWAAGQHSGAREVAGWALDELGLPGSEPVMRQLVLRFEEASHTGRVVALAGARDLLAALEAAGLRSVLVCDTGLTPGRVVRRLLDRAGLLAHLSELAFSDEVGAPKPDRRPFLAAIGPLGLAPEEILHVGDLRRTDVAGARALGMQTVRMRASHDDRSPGEEADHVVDSHRELATMLGLRLHGDEDTTQGDRETG